MHCPGTAFSGRAWLGLGAMHRARGSRRQPTGTGTCSARADMGLQLNEARGSVQEAKKWDVMGWHC